LNIDISQGSVATHLGCGVYLNMALLQIYYWAQKWKKIWKSVNIWWSYGQEFGVLFFWLTVYIPFCKELNTLVFVHLVNCFCRVLYLIWSWLKRVNKFRNFRQKFSGNLKISINMARWNKKKLKTYLSIVQGNRWPVYFWFSYDEFVGFYIWLTLLILRSIYNLSINQKGTHQACVKAHYNIFLEIFSNSTFPENSQPFIWTFFSLWD